MEEMPLVRTGLEGTYQAAQVAKEAQERMSGPGPKQQQQQPGFQPRQTWGLVDDDKIPGGSFASTEESDDHLPEGFTFEGIPRFKRVHGWDKDNKQLRLVDIFSFL